MQKEHELITQLDNLFHPQSVAVVGVPRGMKTGRLFLTALLEQGFQGHLYPVNPEARELDGLRVYPNVAAIPGPVDLAIVLVPKAHSLPVIKECAAKGVKGAVLFTAGYKESGSQTGKTLEEAMLRVAQASGMRLIGPNGMGFYVPKSGLSFFPGLSKESGPVGFISHSGSLTNILGRVASQKGIGFSKVVSLGNECDLTCAEFLTYLGQDSETGLIGCYLEGIKDGPVFLEALQKASLRKPVILWKVGLTPQGALAAVSHTGALAGERGLWKFLVRQGGAVPVVGLEALVDSLMGFSFLPDGLGDRMAIISGPGGLAVAAAEACGNWGLKLAKLSDRTQSALAQFVPPTGTSLRNPIDVGLSASIDMDIYIGSARAAAADPGVDAVVVIGIGLTPEGNNVYTKSMIQAQQEFQKPFLMVNIPGFDPVHSQQFYKARVPFFESSERAISTYARLRNYQLRREKRLA